MTVTEHFIVCDQCRQRASAGDDMNSYPGWFHVRYGWAKGYPARDYDFCSLECATAFISVNGLADKPTPNYGLEPKP